MLKLAVNAQIIKSSRFKVKLFPSPELNLDFLTKKGDPKISTMSYFAQTFGKAQSNKWSRLKWKIFPAPKQNLFFYKKGETSQISKRTQPFPIMHKLSGKAQTNNWSRFQIYFFKPLSKTLFFQKRGEISPKTQPSLIWLKLSG